MKVEQAITMAKNGESIKGVVLEDLDTVQVSVRDALSLARSGIVVPEQNVFYDDAEIEYDEEIDEVKWSDENLNLSWEEKAKLFSKAKLEDQQKPVTLEITTDDIEVNSWLSENRERVSEVIKPIIKSLFTAEKMIKVK